MQPIIDNLRSFNRKERFHLIGTALGKKDFALSEEFRVELNNKLELTIPTTAFVGMDYHLDWIWASLYMHFNLNNNQNKIYPNIDGIITANQEDIDLIITFLEDSICHIVMLEAKVDTGWTNKQMNSKANRFTKLFGADGKKWDNVMPHFIIASPNEPIHLKTEDWPDWMKPNGYIKWLKLILPPFVRVIRCDEQGKITEDGKYWTVK